MQDLHDNLRGSIIEDNLEAGRHCMTRGSSETGGSMMMLVVDREGDRLSAVIIGTLASLRRN